MIMENAERQQANIVITGRSFLEYCGMFGLDLSRPPESILGIGDGISNFNAEATRRGWNVVSVDPIYARSAPDIAAVYCSAIAGVVAKLKTLGSHWIWDYHKDIAELLSHRQEVAADFISDYPVGQLADRYIHNALPSLKFNSNSFSVALCSHVLFSWGSVLDGSFHQQSVREMLRVADEVRIFPTSQSLSSSRSPHVEGVIALAKEMGCITTFEQINERHLDATAERIIIRKPTC